MKIIAIAGATGGCGKTTTAVRLAEAAAVAGFPSGVVDLSPFPTAQWLQEGTSTFTLGGRSATTPAAVRALLQPLREKTKILFLDTGHLEEAAIAPWLAITDGLILATRCDAFALRALPATWKALERLRATAPNLEFLGFIPTMVQESEAKTLHQFELAAPKYLLPARIALDNAEYLRSQATVFSGLAPIASTDQARLSQGYSAVVTWLQTRYQIVPEARAKDKEVGVFTKLWRLAARSLAPKATVEGRT